MRDQIIEITGQTPFISTGERYERQGIIPNLQGSYWMQVYPPLTDMKTPMPGTSQLCPWSMIAEITDAATPGDRKQRVLDALRSGQRTMSLYDLPSHRILFMEDMASRKISVWVD
jgi:hypothetical protein